MRCRNVVTAVGMSWTHVDVVQYVPKRRAILAVDHFGRVVLVTSAFHVSELANVRLNKVGEKSTANFRSNTGGKHMKPVPGIIPKMANHGVQQKWAEMELP